MFWGDFIDDFDEKWICTRTFGAPVDNMVVVMYLLASNLEWEHSIREYVFDSECW